MAAGRFYNIIGQVDQQLSEAAFRSGIVAEHRGEGGITEWFGEALPKCFAGSGVIAESRQNVSIFSGEGIRSSSEERISVCPTYLRKQRTTCFSRRAVCCSTN